MTAWGDSDEFSRDSPGTLQPPTPVAMLAPYPCTSNGENMAASASTDFLAAVTKGLPYVPIPLASLRLDTRANFDLYLRARPDEPAVLYAERNVPFGEEARRRLLENKVDTLYIEASEITTYRRYLERHLPAILSDPEVRIEEKSRILYTSAQGLLKDVLDNPRLDGGMERTKDIVKNTVQFLFNERAALRHLIQTASLDYYIYTHSVNGCVYAVALAQRALRLPAGQLHELGYGALLRDVGMAEVDPEIVNNQGRLTVTQFDVLRQHPLNGEKLLRAAGGFSSATLSIVRHHHERLDGKGYPDGLAGDQIAPPVRICIIADVFDALTTHRPYRKAMTSFEALQLMSADMRRELDPELLKAFIDLMGHPD